MAAAASFRFINGHKSIITGNIHIAVEVEIAGHINTQRRRSNISISFRSVFRQYDYIVILVIIEPGEVKDSHAVGSNTTGRDR